MEFIYAQSPHTMKGLLIGLLYFSKGVSAALAVAIFSILAIPVCAESLCNVTTNRLLWYNDIDMAVALIGLGMYTAAALLYKKRTRDKIDDHYNIIVEHFTRHTRRYSDEHEESM